MTEMKGIGRKYTQLNDYFRNRRRYCGLKREAKERKVFITLLSKKIWKTCYGETRCPVGMMENECTRLFGNSCEKNL